MNRSRRFVMSVLGAIGSLVVALLGYWSGLWSRDTCDLATARWLASSFQDVDTVYCVGWEAMVDPVMLFGRQIAVLRQAGPRANVNDVPSLFVGRGKCYLPFVVSVDWEWITGRLRGESGKCTYLCLFGRIMWHRCKEEWIY